MARHQKNTKPKVGQAKNFITRTQAVRKLQISLADFRRLCIFKGIYPREPKNKRKITKGATPSTTFYYTKDVQYLLHEPLLARFREHKALSKKIARSLGKGEYGDAARLDQKDSARLSLDHIIKERYPTFTDALRDLDDALSMLFLFANLPSVSGVPPKTIRLCQRLCHEFQHYVILSHSLEKSFLSVRGIYYQATIQGQDIMWLVPYKFVQRVTSDVDFKIMGTFVEFYTTLLGFVNYRLYTSLGLVYPPKFSARSDERGGELGAFTIEGVDLAEDNEVIESSKTETSQQQLEAAPAATAKNSEQALQQAVSAQIGAEVEEVERQSALTTQNNGDIDTFVAIGDDADILLQPQASDFSRAKLFAGMHFYISRESPRQPLEFIMKAFGCKRVSWPEILGDGYYTRDEKDTTITHQIIDRPSMPTSDASKDEDSLQVRAGYVIPGRIYVQPQWIWDCINANKLLRPDLYASGTILPPHLSPWVKANRSLYDPSIPLAEQEREGEADDEIDAQNALPLTANGNTETTTYDPEEAEETDDNDDDHGMQIADEDEDEDEEDKEDEDESEDDNDMASDLDVEGIAEATEIDEEAESDLEGQADRLYQAELAAEASGKDASIAPEDSEIRARKEARKARRRQQQQQDEELQRQLGMMSKKKRKLYEKMRYSNQQKENEAAKLRSKRRKIEQS